MKKAIGLILLFLSALSMTMCTKAGPEMREFVLSPSGAWVWLIWLVLLIGGVTLTVTGRKPEK